MLPALPSPGASWRGCAMLAVLSACSPPPPARPAPPPCSQALALVDAVEGHGLARLAAAQRACNQGCARGCGVAAEIALTGRNEAADPSLARALARVGCEANDARSCFLQATASRASPESDPGSAQVLLERACNLGDDGACAWAVAEGAAVAVPSRPAALRCDDPLAGEWRAARRDATVVEWEELRLVLERNPSRSLGASLVWTAWGGAGSVGVPPRCETTSAVELDPSQGFYVGGSGLRSRRFAWTAESTGSPPTGAERREGQVERACGRGIGVASFGQVALRLEDDGTLAVAFETVAGKEPTARRFVRVRCGGS